MARRRPPIEPLPEVIVGPAVRRPRKSRKRPFTLKATPKPRPRTNDAVLLTLTLDEVRLLTTLLPHSQLRNQLALAHNERLARNRQALAEHEEIMRTWESRRQAEINAGIEAMSRAS